MLITALYRSWIVGLYRSPAELSAEASHSIRVEPTQRTQRTQRRYLWFFALSPLRVLGVLRVPAKSGQWGARRRLRSSRTRASYGEARRSAAGAKAAAERNVTTL